MKNVDIKFIESFESIISELLPSKEVLIHEAIHKCAETTNTWLNKLPAPASELNIRIYFIQRLAELVPTHEVLQNEKLLSVLLDDVGFRKVGDFIELKGERWEVIWRKISKNFGVEFGLRSSSGKVVSREFID
jgi:hypothetical protein